MGEQKIVESTMSYQKTLKKVCFVLFGILLVVGIITMVAYSKYKSAWEIDANNLFDLKDVYTQRLIVFVFLLLVNVVFCVFYFLISKEQIVVTNKRVYGRTSFGKQVDLPLDSISAVGTTLFKGIVGGTSSGRIKFLGISNRNEIYEEIKKILADRQSKEVKTNAPVTNITQEQSSADELKKFKDLLDSGVITQEEFDAKKKQLLGL